MFRIISELILAGMLVFVERYTMSVVFFLLALQNFNRFYLVKYSTTKKLTKYIDHFILAGYIFIVVLVLYLEFN